MFQTDTGAGWTCPTCGAYVSGGMNHYHEYSNNGGENPIGVSYYPAFMPLNYYNIFAMLQRIEKTLENIERKL